MLKPYKTLLGAGEDELVINKSRFLCHARPVTTEEAALGFIAEMRSVYKDASHNCYAYAIGSNMGIMRYSDDGEPGGTAGMPIMEVIKAKDITDCVLVITRYFGGILLGAGGLVRAYSQSAALAVNAAGIGTMYPTAHYLAEVAYPLLGRAEFFLKDKPILLNGKEFTDKVTLDFSVRCSDEESLINEFYASLDGRLDYIKTDETYMAWRE